MVAPFREHMFQKQLLRILRKLIGKLARRDTICEAIFLFLKKGKNNEAANHLVSGKRKGEKEIVWNERKMVIL